MKTYIENKLLQLILIVTVIAFVVGIGIFFRNKMQHFKEAMKQFETQEVKGIVIKYKDLTHSDYYLWLRDGSIENRYFLPNFKQYITRIQIGDSLFKPPNSMVFQLYKKDRKTDVKVENLEIAY